ncbi:hypothetical protein GCM10007049_00140 [Echinicola pacifica]|uniref:Planctomycete cytochrome C n=1 Tax=Echinicola pacifica TaxID=346377 RepID=A0A918PK58_9BACT|nr:c-type cytochrome domain-containing protein [Echinicola pacifica]GGZ12423.1 hypothetical protein GCM10007049_00140 [Echinicola pacifica]
MDWAQFIGRFHPLVVHLPIGFLLFGLILELLSFLRKSDSADFRKIIAWSYLASAFGAMMSALIGLMLAQGGGYDAAALANHKWMGFALVGLTALLYWSKSRKWDKKSPLVAYGLVGVSFVLVSLTGHLGGNLTHGSDYLLVHAPNPIKRLAGMETGEGGDTSLPGNPDSILVFQHIIQPVLEEKCISCHNPAKAKGGLDLSSLEAMRAGGESGTVLSGGMGLESELVHRITLPESSTKYMPPQGNGMSYGEIALLKWWVSQGAPDSLSLAAEELPIEIVAILDRDYKVDASPRPFIDKLTATAITDEQLQEVRAAGLQVNRLTPDSQLLEVSLQGGTFDSHQAELLQNIASNIVYADFSRATINGQAFEKVALMKNLIRIDLRHSTITDAEMTILAGQPHLEVVNIYGTQISQEGLKVLGENTATRKVYVWNTLISPTEMEALSQQFPHLNLIGGASAPSVSS